MSDEPLFSRSYSYTTVCVFPQGDVDEVESPFVLLYAADEIVAVLHVRLSGSGKRPEAQSTVDLVTTITATQLLLRPTWEYGRSPSGVVREQTPDSRVAVQECSPRCKPRV